MEGGVASEMSKAKGGGGDRWNRESRRSFVGSGVHCVSADRASERRLRRWQQPHPSPKTQTGRWVGLTASLTPIAILSPYPLSVWNPRQNRRASVRGGGHARQIQSRASPCTPRPPPPSLHSHARMEKRGIVSHFLHFFPSPTSISEQEARKIFPSAPRPPLPTKKNPPTRAQEKYRGGWGKAGGGRVRPFSKTFSSSRACLVEVRGSSREGGRFNGTVARLGINDERGAGGGDLHWTWTMNVGRKRGPEGATGTNPHSLTLSRPWDMGGEGRREWGIASWKQETLGGGRILGTGNNAMEIPSISISISVFVFGAGTVGGGRKG